MVEVVKNSSTSSSANDGEFETSTTTFAPASTSASPSPVMVFTPELGEAATVVAVSVRCSTTLDPMRPVPPMTTIFMTGAWCLSVVAAVFRCRHSALTGLPCDL